MERLVCDLPVCGNILLIVAVVITIAVSSGSNTQRLNEANDCSVVGVS